MSTDLVLTDKQTQGGPPAKGLIPAEDLPQIAERYRTGESLSRIAETYGVDQDAVRQRLEKWALSGKGDTDFHGLVTEYLVEQTIAAKDKLITAPDMLGVARAREETKYWQWMLERRRAKLFGPKQEIDVDKTVHVHVHRDQIPTLETTRTPEGGYVAADGSQET
jgi:hypothetical protein